MSRIKNFDEVIERIKTHLLDYLEEKEINTKTNFNCIHSDHEDTVASCGVMRQSDFQKWHCFGCGEYGDIFDAVVHIEDKPSNGPEYIKETVLYLAEKYGIEVQMEEPTEEEKYRIEAFLAYKKAAHYVANHATEKAIAEMQRRAWVPSACAARFIGAVDSFEGYKDYMKKQGFTVSFLESIDLLNKYLFNENNLLFTVSDEYGRPCGFGARNLDFDPENKESRKYINSKNFGTDVKCQIYEKSKRLYNIHNAKKQVGPLYIMEGYGDVETAVQAGLEKAVCVGGTAFTDYHIIELSRMGITDIVLCMDGDERGQQSLDRMLEKFNTHREFSVHIISIPESLDPDDYIRQYGLAAFNELKRWSAFEWKLANYDDRIDTFLIRKEVVPIIAAESSPIVREEMAIVLSERIGITADAIKAEVEQILDQTEQKRALERQNVLSTLSANLTNSPNDWRLSINKAVQELETLSESYDEDMFSPAAYLKDLEIIQTNEETHDSSESTFEFDQWREFTEAVSGDWTGTLNVLGGAANTGKTGLMAAMALQLAMSEDNNSLVLFHTIDDTVPQFTTRLVCQYAEQKYSSITLNMIKNPSGFPAAKAINDARKYGYNEIKKLVMQNRLIVRGGEQGKGANTLSFAQEMIRYYKKMFPDKRIVYFLDNFHRLRDFASMDERLRFKALSNATKDMAKKEEIPVWATMEYNKAGAWDGRPTNNSIAESAAMEYDANVIIHIYNELHQKGDDAQLYFTRTDHQGRAYKAPRLELIFGKNKIGSFKGKLYFDFYTEQSRYTPVPSSLVQADLERIRQAAQTNPQQRHAS
jgi:DNA primase